MPSIRAAPQGGKSGRRIYDFLTPERSLLTPSLRVARDATDMKSTPAATPTPTSAPTKRRGVDHKSYRLKRALLGPALSTERLEDERLGKPTALAVFASDNLSSVAYATEEILHATLPFVGAVAFALVLPITWAILGVLLILILSYRQTIKAYPSAGGAYIVTKDNLGLIPAQVAGVALLTDYILTVAVSVSAGVAALTTAVHALYPYRVWLAVGCVVIIAIGNLRGVRESGRIFAIPTYFFIGMMGLLLGSGLFKALTGSLEPLPLPAEATEVTGAISLFLILHAFASGGAAVTGVEAISNGVPAFRKPAWKNARITLVWMGSLLGVMFLGLSFLAVQLHAAPLADATVIGRIAEAVFGKGVLFYALQIATMLILVLAANTAFADFPRLASFQAGDEFMPRQLTKRGHRLVFSNGIIGLAAVASALVIGFQADVHKLIPLYAIGVFTSFTLSQAGMAKRHLRLREPRWRTGLAINAVGAMTTAIVSVVIAWTKFIHGAWAIIVLVPILVWVLVRMNRRYEAERSDLEHQLPAFDGTTPPSSACIVIVEHLDHPTMHAIQYARTLQTRAIHAIHFQQHADETERLLAQWGKLDTRIPLKVLSARGNTAVSIAGYVAGFPDDLDVNVIVPGTSAPRGLARWRRDRNERRVFRALVPYRRTRVTLVRDHTVSHDDTGSNDHTPRSRHSVIVLVDRLDRAALSAVRYGLSLGAADVRGVHAVVDPENQEALLQRWIDLAPPIPFDLIECWDRNVPRAIELYVRELQHEQHEITVVLPRRDYAELRQRVLHDRTSRSIIQTLGRYAHVSVSVVPYLIAHDPDDAVVHSLG